MLPCRMLTMKKPATHGNTPAPKAAKFVDLNAEFGDPSDERAELAELLCLFFPQPELMPDGAYYYTPAEVQYFDALFERFGLAFRSSDDKFDDIKYLTGLWYRLVNGVGGHIECARHSPKLHEYLMNTFPLDFQHYLAAVVANDRETAKLLAAKLDVENLDAPFVKPMFG